MFEYLWLPCMVTVAAIALSAVLCKEFLKNRAGQIAVGYRADNDSATKNRTTESAARTCTSPQVNETSTSSGYDYEVFLSFRGPDTRAGFTDFLYTSLTDAGIRTFKDDEELRVGEEFAPELLQAINQSKISIPIFSKDYASSVWCLKELVQMVECQKTGRQKIMPIFYDVAPSEVRYQKEGYAKAFLAHIKKKRHDEKTIQEWKDALGVVGALNGWDLHSEEENRREGKFAKKLTKEVFRELKKAYLVVSDCLVSVDNHVDAIMGMIGTETSETRIIGIHGMGGIGKTTIAKIIYNQLSKKFDGCCFLSNIRETSKLKGIHHLQHQLISDILNKKWIDIRNIDEGIETIKDRLPNKRVLLLLDDVDGQDHINALVGNHDWFGRGSKLIITTRKKDVLKEVDCIYEVNFMDDHQSLQLFSKHAFRRDSPLDEYINQSHRAICIAGGLPLALEVIGSLLSCTDKKKWDDKLEMLEKVPPVDVQSKLKISFDALEVRQQHIFLDIACFFIGYDKDIMVYFWEKFEYFPEEVMEVLQNMSLIKIRWGNEVWMHDQLRDLGREIIRRESKMKIEEQSRVWDPTDALKLLRRHEGETKVEALRLRFDHESRYCFTSKDFKKVSNLRFLQVDGLVKDIHAEERLFCHESPSNVLPINVIQENSYFLPQLRWLSWQCIPPTFNITNFYMKEVVFLDLSWSKITHDWKGWSHMEVMRNLKVMDLSHCHCLERTPNFPALSNLERLSLNSCDKLVKIDESICQLKSLVSLDVGKCGSLRRLPDKLGVDLASLEYLSLKLSKSFERLPNTLGNLESLTELDIFGTEVEELPDSVGQLKNLKIARMSLVGKSKIPDALWTIKKLEEIQVLFCNFKVEVEIGNCIYENQSLRILKLFGVRINGVPKLPESLVILELQTLHMDTFPDLSKLTNLKELELSFGPRDDGGESDGPVEEYPMPRWIGNLSKLETLTLISDYLTTLPTDISSLLPRLQHLELVCPNLRCLPSLPSSLSSLRLRSNYVTPLPTDISSLLPRLERLQLECPNLRCLPSLPSSLSFLFLAGCKSLGSLGDLSNLKNLSDLMIYDAVISVIGGLDGSENLDLQLSELQQVWILPDLSNINQLRRLEVGECGNLVEIQGELPQFLEELVIYGCGSLQKLPELSSLKALRHVSIKLCGKLNVEAISSLCSEKSIEYDGDETNYKYESGSEGEDAESESEAEGEDDESEVEDHEVESEAKGEDDESEV